MLAFDADPAAFPALVDACPADVLALPACVDAVVAEPDAAEANCPASVAEVEALEADVAAAEAARVAASLSVTSSIRKNAVSKLPPVLPAPVLIKSILGRQNASKDPGVPSM